jgi:hypothetical protein
MLKITTFGNNADILVANARFILRRVACKTYKGWDEDFDMSFDKRSIWVISSDNTRKIHGFCKVVFATNDQRLPSEYNKEMIFINKNEMHCAEVTSFIYRDFNQAHMVVRAAMLEIERLGCELCFCTVDTTNIKALNLITESYKFRRYHANPITFSGMWYSRCNGIPLWSYLVQDKISRLETILDLTTGLYQE